MRFIAILATFPVFSNLALATGGFISDCDSCSLLDDHTLECRCQTNNSKNHAVTSLDLNQCITNNNGVLVATPNGDFGGSCSGSRLAGTTLITNCNGGTASINLNDFVDDSNGFLHCFSSTACCISGTCSNPPGKC